MCVCAGSRLQRPLNQAPVTYSCQYLHRVIGPLPLARAQRRIQGDWCWQIIAENIHTSLDSPHIFLGLYCFTAAFEMQGSGTLMTAVYGMNGSICLT